VLFCCDTSVAFASAETPIPNEAIANVIPSNFFIVFANPFAKKIVGLAQSLWESPT